jgi:hypothetical protein
MVPKVGDGGITFRGSQRAGEAEALKMGASESVERLQVFTNEITLGNCHFSQPIRRNKNYLP